MVLFYFCISGTRQGGNPGNVLCVSFEPRGENISGICWSNVLKSRHVSLFLNLMLCHRLWLTRGGRVRCCSAGLELSNYLDWRFTERHLNENCTLFVSVLFSEKVEFLLTEVPCKAIQKSRLKKV